MPKNKTIPQRKSFFVTKEIDTNVRLKFIDGVIFFEPIYRKRGATPLKTVTIKK